MLTKSMLSIGRWDGNFQHIIYDELNILKSLHVNTSPPFFWLRRRVVLYAEPGSFSLTVNSLFFTIYFNFAAHMYEINNKNNTSKDTSHEPQKAFYDPVQCSYKLVFRGSKIPKTCILFDPRWQSSSQKLFNGNSYYSNRTVLIL